MLYSEEENYYILKLQHKKISIMINPLNAELNPICYLLALLGASSPFSSH
jgi:hypothetical protein